MVAILLSRATWLNMHLNSLHEMDPFLSDELIGTGLPTFFEDDSHEYVSILLMGNFLSKIKKEKCIDNFAISASRQATHHDLTYEYSRRAALLPELNSRLLLFFQCLPIEWNCAHSWIAESGKSARIYSNFSRAVPTETLRYFECLQHAIVRSIIREFAGPRWNPDTISFQSNFTKCDETSKQFPNSSILVGEGETFMEFPLDILKLRFAASPRNSATSGSNISSPRIPLGLTHDFIGALKLALRSYLPDYYPSLDVAAAIAGVGARTLQRRLAQFGLTYSKLVEQIRLETAIDLLRDPSRRIIDIAYKVGYGDPSHFTRAFRRALGASPKAFRQSLPSRKFCEVYRIPYNEVGSGVAHTEHVPIGNSANDMVGLPDLAIAKMQERFDFPEMPTRKPN